MKPIKNKQKNKKTKKTKNQKNKKTKNFFYYLIITFYKENLFI
tara:strand:- start:91 stop:219 length:129 start_codon:yes stop_codon:yes gene_type:complete